MITLTDKLAMTADEHCFIVGIPRTRADGSIMLDAPTYHTTAAQAVQNAVKRAMREGVKDGRVTTLREFIDRQSELQTELETLIKPLK